MTGAGEWNSLERGAVVDVVAYIHVKSMRGD
jgi:hypothetical protein